MKEIDILKKICERFDSNDKNSFESCNVDDLLNFILEDESIEIQSINELPKKCRLLVHRRLSCESYLTITNQPAYTTGENGKEYLYIRINPKNQTTEYYYVYKKFHKED
jgi:predicted methyltransferase